MKTSEFETLRFEVSDGIATITLDRPPLNLIDARLIEEYLSDRSLSLGGNLNTQASRRHRSASPPLDQGTR